jgi:hypothetical protein
VVFLLQQVDFLDSSGRIETEPVKLLVIGYIRKLQSAVITFLLNLAITQESDSTEFFHVLMLVQKDMPCRGLPNSMPYSLYRVQ